MSLSKRHHYTPRYYLKRFENEDGAMWRLDLDKSAVTLGNNERFGFKNHWNRLRNPPEGYEADWAERRLSEIDGVASAVVARILAGDFPKDLRALAYAISFMQNNQPRVMRELDDKHGEAVRHWSEDYRLIVKTHAALSNGLRYVPCYYAVQVIDESDGDARFLTSSNPLIEFQNLPSMLLPLSSRHCLFLSHDPKHSNMEPMFLRCDKASVREINDLTIKNAWQYVYSCTPEFSEHQT